MFKTYDSDIDGITNKLGFSKRSFAEWGEQVSKSVTESEGKLNKFKSAVKTAFTVPKDYVKNESGEIVTKNNIDSYIPLLTTDDARYELLNLQNIQKEIDKTKGSWDDYANCFKDNEKYLLTYAKSNKVLDSSVVEVKESNIKAREEVIKQNSSLKQTTIKAKAAAFGLQMLSIAGNMIASWLVGEAISLAITGIDHLINAEKYEQQALESATETAKKYSDQIKETREESEKTANTANEVAEKYAKLAQGVDVNTNRNKTLSNDDYKEFLDLNKQLADLFPTLTKGYDENGNAILGLSGGVNTVTESIKKLVEQQERLAKQDLKDSLEKYVNGDDDSEGQLKSIDGQKKKVDALKYQLKELENIRKGFETGSNKYNKKLSETQYVNYADDIQSLLGDKAKKALEKVTTSNNVNGSTVYTIDFSKLELSESEKGKILKSYSNTFNDLNSKLDTAKSELDNKNKELSQQMMIWVEDLDLYKNNESLQTPLMTMIQNIDWSAHGLKNYDQVKDFIQDNILTDLQTVCEDPDTKAKVTSAYLSLFSIDFSKLSIEDAKKQLDNIFKSIIFSINPNIGKKDLQKKLDEYYKTFGMEDYNDSYDKLNSSIGNGKKDKNSNINSIAQNAAEVKKLQKYTKDFNLEQVQTWLTATNGAKNATDAINRYEETLKNNSNNSTITSFKEAWKSLSSDTKKSLTDLAEAGQLTEKAFNKVANTDALTNTGLSVQDLINKINALVDSSKQLSAMRTGITAITSAYDEKKESKKNVVSSATLSSLSDTLGVSDWSKSDKKVWENYKKTAGDGKKSLSELKKAQDDLATSYVNSNNFLSNLDNTNKGYYISLLQEMGVTNAETVVTQTLANKKYNLALQNEFVKDKSVSLKKATISEINGFIDEKKYSDKAKNALYKLALQKKLTNGTTLDFNSDIGQIKAFVNALGGQIDALTALQKWKANKHKLQGMPSDIRDMKNQEYLEKAQKEVDAVLKKVNTKTDVKTSKGNNSNSNKNSKNSNNSKSKSSTQQIDWIARAIDVLNNKLDLANAKYNNLTSLKGKKNNLAEQIKYTTKLINAEKVALSKYTAQYKAVKLDGKLKTAVKEGRLKGTRKQLIATYGEKTANKIQKYQDLYDKAQTARTAIQTQRKNRTDKRKERLQLNVDDADSRRSLADARIENNTSAKAKNVQEEKKYKSTKKSYNYQIKIAKLEKDNVKVATLRAQKEKALLDIRVQEKQNLADENEATYNLNQQLETNAVGYKNKNLYETRSRESLKSQYSYLIEIAKLQGNITEQKRLEAELREKTQSSYMQEINNIKDDYNNRTSLNESDISTNQSKIEKLQAEGLRVSSNFYATNMAINANKRQTLVEEMSQLQSHMNTLTPYSSDWYSTVQDINTIAQNIDTCDKNTVEWQQAINDLELSKFQLINSQLESTINHLDFLIDMIDEDDMFGKDSGNITDAGITALSLYIDKMNETSESIKNKRAEWSKFQEQVARGTSGYDEKTIQDKNEEYASSLRNLIKTNKEVEDSITSIVENGLNKQKDALDDIISKYKQALDRASELRDYQKDVADQTKNINSIEKRIKALSGNDLSEEARARIQKLTVELNDAKDNLQDTQYARWKTDQENMLDDLSDSFEQSITDALANTDSIIEAVQMLVADNGSTVKTYLESMGFGGDSNIVGTKYASNGAYNSTFSTYDGNYVRYNYDMNGNLLSVDTLDSGGNMISSLQNTNSSTNGSSSASTSTAPTNTATAPTVSNASSGSSSGNNYSALQMKIDKFLNSSLKDDKKSAGADQRLSHDQLFKYLYEKYHHKTISKENEAKLGKLLGIKTKSSKKITDEESKKILKALKNAGYANGGVVSGLKGAIRANGDSLIATVNPRESILTEEFTNMLPKAVDIMSNFNTLPSLIPKSILNNRSVSQDIKIGDINVTVDAPNAYDANGITQAIKQSTALQKTLQDATVGQVSKSFNNKLSI